MTWILWALFLMVQNAAFTLVSRARNSGSYLFHAIAAVGSNGVFILSMYFTVGFLQAAKENPLQMLKVALFYTVFTVIGSVFMHWFSVNYLEKGKRRVGA